VQKRSRRTIVEKYRNPLVAEER